MTHACIDIFEEDIVHSFGVNDTSNYVYDVCVVCETVSVFLKKKWNITFPVATIILCVKYFLWTQLHVSLCCEH